MKESDHKKAYQEYLKVKTFRTVVIYFAIKNKYVFIKYAVVIYVAMCCQSLAMLGCIHILMYNIFVHQSGGGLGKSRGRKERALQAKACTRFQF